MVALVGLLVPASFGSTITAFGITLSTSAGLTIAGSLVNIAGSLLLSAATNALFGPDVPDAVRPDNIQINTKNGTAPRVAHYGIVKTGGNIVFHRVVEGTTYRLVVHGHGQIDKVLETYLNDEPVTINGAGDVTDARYYYYHPRVQIFRRKGVVPETHYGEITALWAEWTANHRLDGQWTSLIRRESVPPEQYREMYPNNEPQITQLAQTKRCFDPRTGLTAFTENAALIIADYVGSADGLNQPDAFDDETLIEAANDSDVLRTLKAGGTEPKYRIGGSYLLTEAPQEVLGRMLVACAGRIRLKPTGDLGLTVGVWKEPEFVLRYEHILEVGAFTGGPDKLDRYNQLPARYNDHNLGHIEVDAEPWLDLDRVADDGGEIMVGPSLNTIMSPSHAQTRQVMAINMERANPLWSAPFTCKPSALPAFYEDTIKVDIPELGLVGYCEVRQQGIVFDGGLMAAVTFSLNAIRPTPFSQSLDDQGEVQELPPANVLAGIPTPQSVVAAAAGTQSAQNAFAAGIGVGWAAPPSDALFPVVKYRNPLFGTWQNYPVGNSATNVVIGGLVDGDLYDISVAFATPGGTVGTAVIVEGVVASAVSTPPAPPTGLAVVDAGSGVASIDLVSSISAGLWKTEIYRDDGVTNDLVVVIYAEPGVSISFDDDSGAGTFDWTARSVNVSGIESTTDAGPVTQTIT